MNERRINSKLTQIHKALYESIKDPVIKELVKENTIITGGCITSLLLKEQINDVDVYFTNKDTVLKVAEYYVQQFINNKQNVKILPKVYLDGENKDRVRIKVQSAGIAGQDIDDKNYQYFEQVEDNGETGEEYLQAPIEDEAIREITQADKIDAEALDDQNKNLYQPIYLTDNAITLSGKIQLVIRFYGDAKDIHKNFDYVHCTNYWTSKNKKLHLNEAALKSTLEKELIYMGSKYPLCSVMRMRKFLKKGWYINAGQILKMSFQISKLDLEDFSVLADQLVGVDTAYFAEFIACMEKDKANIVDFKPNMPYICSLVDKIF